MQIPPPSLLGSTAAAAAGSGSGSGSMHPPPPPPPPSAFSTLNLRMQPVVSFFFLLYGLFITD